jgi:hypothetical protein
MADIKISELPSGSITLSGFVPVSLSDGSATQKLTVEDIGSINVKRSVLLATTENIGSLYGTLVVDGTIVSEGDRVLVKNQTSSEQNGIYVVNSTGFWLRSNDFNSNGKVTRGSIVFVISGIRNRGTTWILDSSTVNLGTSPLNFIRTATGNISIFGNSITSTDLNGNVSIEGSGTGNVFVENIRVFSRTISTREPNTNLLIQSEGTGSILINGRSNQTCLIGNVFIKEEAISTLSGNLKLGNLSIYTNSFNFGNLIVSPVSISSGSNVSFQMGGDNLIISCPSVPQMKFPDLEQLFPLATIAYVDNSLRIMDSKYSVRVATTSNISLFGTQSIDGVNTFVGDRVLVKNQTDGIQNGIYDVGVNAWSRSSDSNSFTRFNPNVFLFVEEGNTQADTGWTLVNNASSLTGNTLVDGSYVFRQFADARNQSRVISGNTSSNVTVVANTAKYLLLNPQTDINVFLSPIVNYGKEIIIRNNSTTYNINVYNGTNTSSASFGTINIWGQFVYDGVSWQLVR